MKLKNNRVIKIILLAGFLSFNIIMSAQPDQPIISSRPKNNINVNLLGDGSPISLNYERLSSVKSGFFITSKIGIGYNEEFDLKLNLCLFGPCTSTPTPSKTIKYLTIPHHITGILGSNSLFFEGGIGGTLLFGDGNSNYIIYPIIGFRVQPRRIEKINFRLFGCFPLGSYSDGAVDVGENNALFFPFGISLGYCF